MREIWPCLAWGSFFTVLFQNVTTPLVVVVHTCILATQLTKPRNTEHGTQSADEFCLCNGHDSLPATRTTHNIQHTHTHTHINTQMHEM